MKFTHIYIVTHSEFDQIIKVSEYQFECQLCPPGNKAVYLGNGAMEHNANYRTGRKEEEKEEEKKRTNPSS